MDPASTPLASSFVRKLYHALDVHSSDRAVLCWDDAGRSFTIHDIDVFERDVMPRHFRGRLDTFRLHLEEHGFQRCVLPRKEGGNGSSESYWHEHFVRGQPSMLNQIVQVVQPSERRRRQRRSAQTKSLTSPNTAPPRPRLMVALSIPRTKQSSFRSSSSPLSRPSVTPTRRTLPSLSNLQTTPPRIPPTQETTTTESVEKVNAARSVALQVVDPLGVALGLLNTNFGTRSRAQPPATSVASESSKLPPLVLSSLVEWLDTSTSI